MLGPVTNTGYTVVNKADIVPCPCGAGSLAGTLRKKKVCVERMKGQPFFLRK